MPLSGEMINALLTAGVKKEAPTIPLGEYVTGGTQTEKAPAKEAAISQRVIEVAATAPATGTAVVLTEINTKTTAGEAVGPLVVGGLYWVRKVSATEVELAHTKAQAESATAGEHIEFTVAVKTTSKLVFVVEGTFAARIKTGFGAAANRKSEDGTAREVESSGTQTAKWEMYWSALTVGTLCGVSEIAGAGKTLETGDILKVTKSIAELL